MSAKEKLRVYIKNVLKYFPDTLLKSKSNLISLELERIFRENGSKKVSEIVALYYPLKGEVDITPFTERIMEEGWKVAFPYVVDERVMEFRAIRDLNDLETGPLGVPQPPKNSEKVNPYYFIVPALAYDLRGVRLGRGGGYYDRYFFNIEPSRHVKIGVCFELQIFEQLPFREEDMRVDMIVTERGVIHTRR